MLPSLLPPEQAASTKVRHATVALMFWERMARRTLAA